MIVHEKRRHFAAPLHLERGGVLPSFDLVYETYGRLNARRDNAILIFHTLSSSQHAAGKYHPEDARPGWWDAAIGPGRMLDTDRFCVISTAVLGGGRSTGPASTDPHTSRPYGMSFPLLTIGDMVQSQRRLIRALGIRYLHAAVGGCLGGFQALEWMIRYPDMVSKAVLIGTAARCSAHTIARNALLRTAIMSDPAWRKGAYDIRHPPTRGIGLAAMLGMLIWLDPEIMEARYGRRKLPARPDAGYFGPEFEIEQFLQRVGKNAMGHMDPNSLLYLTRAMDDFDLAPDGGGLDAVLRPARARTLVVQYDSDWRYPPAEGRRIVEALKSNGRHARIEVLHSRFGHGAFIHDPASLAPLVHEFLDGR